MEAIALGHDIGHTPFGHEGEENLTNEITQKLGENSFHFHHSVQSIRFLDELEGTEYLNNGRRSLNLTLQVLDGILCHDGEAVLLSIKPNRKKTWDDFDREVKKKKTSKRVEIMPMTLEGCLVRCVDTIAYLGRDIEDAVAIGLLKREEFPRVLGDSNRDIVNNLAMDIIEKSRNKDEICYSKERYEQLKLLRDFNDKAIYRNSLIKTQKDKIRDMFLTLYNALLRDVKERKEDSPIFLDHINLIGKGDSKSRYFANTPPEIIVVDYLDGMTDDYFINVFNEMFFPRKLPFNFRQIERVTGLPRAKLLQALKEEERIIDN